MNQHRSQQTHNQHPNDNDLSHSKMVYCIGVFVLCLISFGSGMFLGNYFSGNQSTGATKENSASETLKLPSQSNFPETFTETLPTNDVRYNFSIAYELGNSGLYEKAIVYYEKALALKPQDALILHNLGINLLHAGHMGEAIARFRKALQFKPDDPKTLRHLGYAFAESGQYDNAITFYTKSLTIQPNDAQTRKWMGFTCIDAGKIETAIHHFEKVTELTPDDPFAYDSLGFAHFVLGHKKRAMDYCQKAIELDTQNLILKMNFSEIALMTDHWKQALKMSNQSLQEKGLSAAHHLAMRVIKLISLVCLDKRQDAVDDVQVFLSVYPAIRSFDNSQWNYSGLKDYVKKTNGLREKDKHFFQNLISLAEPSRMLDLKNKSLVLNPYDLIATNETN
ncbi:MAG: tetratricopeptide repeat protein [Candidatus Magnetomorum sp.]|nr:tetratricopeptide repeat protein [Candidatus Magnetomorum sp.]